MVTYCDLNLCVENAEFLSKVQCSFGSTLRLYIGNSNRPADDGDPVGKLKQKTVHQASMSKRMAKQKSQPLTRQ